MQAILLPQQLKLIAKGDTQLYHYNISNNVVNNKITLTKHVFSFLLEGSKELKTNSKTVTIDANKFLIIKQGNCLMSENLSVSKAYRSMLLFFTDASLVSFIAKHKIVLAKGKVTSPYLVCEYDSFIHQFVHGLQLIEALPQQLQQALLVIKLEEILLYLVHKKSPQFLQGLLSNTYQSDAHLATVVQNNRHNILSVQELAFLCNMSISTFKRSFEKAYNTTPQRWFQAQRLEYALQLLQKQKNRPSDIYNLVGFENLSSFTKAFRDKYSITPKQYQISI